MLVFTAREEVARHVELPPGYTIFWSGQYEYMQRAKARLLLIVHRRDQGGEHLGRGAVVPDPV